MASNNLLNYLTEPPTRRLFHLLQPLIQLYPIIYSQILGAEGEEFLNILGILPYCFGEFGFEGGGEFFSFLLEGKFGELYHRLTVIIYILIMRE